VNTPRVYIRIGAFVAGLALVFAAAALAGNAIGPEPPAEDDGMAADHGAEPAAHSEEGDEAVPGLASTQGGLRLELDRSRYEPGAGERVSFTVLGEDGDPFADYEVEHEREMHMILVRRDMEGFQHLHPRRAPDGTWTATADLHRPGAYRVFADFATPEESVTLGADLFVAGAFDPEPLPAPKPTADAGDGYEVSVEGEGGDVAFTVTRDGEPVDDVAPYLGADGPLVALREGDLGFLHTHPSGEPGGPIEFGVEYPSPGRYRLFLQFKHDGEVRTAAFTREVGDGLGH